MVGEVRQADHEVESEKGEDVVETDDDDDDDDVGTAKGDELASLPRGVSQISHTFIRALLRKVHAAACTCMHACTRSVSKAAYHTYTFFLHKNININTSLQ